MSEREIEQLKIDLEKQKLISLNKTKEAALILNLASMPLPKNGLPAEVNILTAMSLIQQDMANKGLVINFDDDGNVVFKQKRDGAEIDYFVDNKKVDLDNYIFAMLTEKKFIEDESRKQDPKTEAVNNFVFQLAEQRVPTNPIIVEETRVLLSELGL